MTPSPPTGSSPPEAARGPDGLTEGELRRGRAEWWDEAFTSLLVDALPRGWCRLLDLGSGFGQAAATLLPALPELRYLGLDLDPARAASCADTLAPWRARAAAAAGNAYALPVGEGELDAVLTVSTLMHLPRLDAALAEIRRVLRPGGRLVAVEADNRVQVFRFGASLPTLDLAFGALYRRLGELGRPPHIGLGPSLPERMSEAGFRDLGIRPHLIRSAHHEGAEVYFDRVSWVADVIAESAGLAASEPSLRRCREEIAALRAELEGQTADSLHAVPMWRCVGLA